MKKFNNVEERRAYNKMMYKKHHKTISQNRQAVTAKDREQLLLIYGGMACVRCEFDDTRALQIDHIDGSGYEQRKSIPTSMLYRKLKKEGYPYGYQVLC